MAARAIEVAAQAEGRLPAIAALTATALLWGSNHVAARAIHDALPLPALIFWRWGLALAVLLPIALPGLLRERAVIRENIWRIALLGGLGVGLFSVCLYAGAYYSLALEVGLLNATTPLWVLLIAAVAGGARPRSMQLAGIFIALAGVLFVLSKGHLPGGEDFHFGIGNASSLAAAVLFAWYTYSLSQRPIAISALSLTALTALSGFVLVFVPTYAGFLALGGTDTFATGTAPGNVVFSVVYIALGPTLFGNLFWIYGASRMGPANAGAFLYMSPLAALVLSTTLLGEPFTLLQAAGGLAILGGLWLSNRRPPARA